MILDTLGNWRKYAWDCERFRKAFGFLESLDPSAADGRYEIDGDAVYCMVQTYETRSRQGHQFEAHRVYADIQYMMKGQESILWAPTPELTVIKPYEPDVELYVSLPAPDTIDDVAPPYLVQSDVDQSVPALQSS